jgi:hypothetical protein
VGDGRDLGRRSGFWTAAALVVLAFLLGGVATTWAVRSGRWPIGAAAPATAIVVKPVVQAPVPTTAVAATVDPATLAVREGVLAGQLAALEARTAAISADALAAGGEAGKAEALLIAAAARRAVDRGLPLGYLEPALQARFGAIQPRAVQAVVEAGSQPVTLEDLRQGLDAIAPDLTTGAGESWWAGVRREFGSLVVLRESGTPSPLPVDRLERARRLLDGGQVEAARAEVARLPGAGGASKWLDAAHRYAQARRAIEALEAAALAGRAVPVR